MAVFSFERDGETAVPAASARLEIIIPSVVCGVLLVATVTVLIVGLLVVWKKKKRSQTVVSVM